MTSSADEKRPISPKQLFQKLLVGNYKEIECIDQASQIKQQRQILISLISEYRVQIQRRMQEFDKLQKLILVRNKLRIQLEQLRNQRISIDRNIQYQIEKHKLNPNEVHQHSQIRAQIQDLRHKNSNLQLRLRQLNQYCVKMERQNILLQKQNIAVEQFNVRTRSRSQIGGQPDCCGNWRQKVRIRRMQEQKLNIGLQNRIRQMQQQNRRYIMTRQAEIAQGNRRRMASFQQRLRKY